MVSSTIYTDFDLVTSMNRLLVKNNSNKEGPLLAQQISGFTQPQNCIEYKPGEDDIFSSTEPTHLCLPPICLVFLGPMRKVFDFFSLLKTRMLLHYLLLLLALFVDIIECVYEAEFFGGAGILLSCNMTKIALLLSFDILKAIFSLAERKTFANWNVCT